MHLIFFHGFYPFVLQEHNNWFTHCGSVLCINVHNSNSDCKFCDTWSHGLFLSEERHILMHFKLDTSAARGIRWNQAMLYWKNMLLNHQIQLICCMQACSGLIKAPLCRRDTATVWILFLGTQVHISNVVMLELCTLTWCNLKVFG